MGELLGHLVDAPLANVMVLAGLAFLAVGAIGKVSASINPNSVSRVISGIVGVALLIYGANAHVSAEAHRTGASSQGTTAVTTQPVHPPPVARPPEDPDTCRQGYVWRDAFVGDHVCVTPETRSQAARQNQLAVSHRSPNGGPYGPDSCVQGFVWRDARQGDHVCVTGAERQQAAIDNQAAASRRIG